MGQKELHYSQAVRIGDRIECSGQGTSRNIDSAVDSMLTQDAQVDGTPTSNPVPQNSQKT